MAKWYEYVVSIGALAGGIFGGWKVYAELSKPKEEVVPNEPFAAGVLDVQRDEPYVAGSITGSYSDVPNPVTSGATYVGPTGTGEVPGTSTLEIPLGASEFSERITPDTKTVILTAPLLYVNEDGTAVLDVQQKLTVNRSVPGGTQQSVVYVDKDGTQYNSEQEVLDAFIAKSAPPEVLAKVGGKDDYSVIEGIKSGKPVNVTNFITSRPEGFPEAKADAVSKDFQTRARALEATLSVSNPGASSSAAIPNFSRLAAVGVDLTQVDLYNVKNPAYLGTIKQGATLTAEQKNLINQSRLAIDARNMTIQEKAQIEENLKARTLTKQQVATRTKELETSGYNEAKAKATLLAHGIQVTGSLSAAQFAALEKRLGETAYACINCQTSAVKPKVDPKATTLSKCLDDKRALFLKQTGRKDFNALTQKEIAVWNQLIAACTI
jgi:hypothetical protein